MTTTYPGLADRDISVLTARTISPTVARQRGYVTVHGDTARHYGFAGAQALAGLVIPRRNTQGFVEPHAQLRPHEPRLDENDRPRKYELPAGARQILDVPPASLPHLTEVVVPILIAESILKGDAIQSAIDPGAFCVLSVNGVYGWRSNGAPISDFWDVPLCEKQSDRITRRRDVVILFDSDTAGNEKVARARHLFTEFLERRGARVKHVDLPIGIDGEKQGIDDCLAGGHTLERLLTTAHPPRRPDPDDDPDDPDRQRIRDLEATLADVQAELRTERAIRQTEHRMLGDGRRSAQERIGGVLLAAEIERIVRHGEHDLAHGNGKAVAVDETGGALINVKRLAELAGCSPKHAGDCLRALKAQGVIDHAVTRRETGETIVTDDGEVKSQYVSICRITPRGTIESLRSDILLADPYHRPPKKAPKPTDRCLDHPDAQIVMRIHDECTVCHKQIGDARDRYRAAGTPPTDTTTTPTTAPLLVIAQQSPEVRSLKAPEVLSENGRGDATPFTAPTVSITTPEVISDLAPAGTQRVHQQERPKNTSANGAAKPIARVSDRLHAALIGKALPPANQRPISPGGDD